MGIFGKKRDINFFKKINKEVITKIVDQWIYIYNIEVDQGTNIYGERIDKSYSGPYKISAIVERSDTSLKNDEKGLDTARNIKVNILRESLSDNNISINYNDVVIWDDEYYEIQFIDENQYVFGKDPKDDLSPDRNTGSNFAIVFKASKINKINLE